MTVPIDTTDCLFDEHIGSVFDSLEEGVIIWGKDRTLLFANDAARRITKLELIPGAVLGPMTHTTVRVLDDHHRAQRSDALPVYRAFNGENVPREEIRYVDRDGTHRWLAVSAKRIVHEDGELKYVISSLRDVSLRRSRESKLEFMVESAKILRFDLDFKHRLIEKAKLTVPALADWCIMDVLEDDKLERVAVIHQDPLQIEKLRSFETRFPRNEERQNSVLDTIKSQKPVFIPRVDQSHLDRIATSPEHMQELRSLNIRSIMIIPISSHGRGVGAMTLAYAESGRTYDENDLEFFQEFCYHLSVVFDNARLFQEIAARDRAKDIFLASLSHELRNPLAPIKSSLELLKLREAATDIREELDIVEHQFNHMARLLNDLLDVSRFTQDRISLSARPIELRRLIERAQRATDAQARNADITLHFAYPSIPISIVADETRLEQAVSNLVSNAIKFTPAGGSIWVDLERSGADAIIRVRDNGRGIAANDLPHIFDMYYQGQNEGPLNSGLGIGLLLVQRIVQMHGGTVEARSDGEGTGSEFTLRLPMAEIHVEELTTTLPRSLAHNLRILIVDDNAPAADALTRLLNKIGAHATAAYSGHEALGSEQLDMIDLFILDVGMPHMDGYQLVHALRELGITAPIVALTGYGLSDDKRRAHEAGFTSHLTKPVGLSDLNELFESVLTTSA